MKVTYTLPQITTFKQCLAIWHRQDELPFVPSQGMELSGLQQLGGDGLCVKDLDYDAQTENLTVALEPEPTPPYYIDEGSASIPVKDRPWQLSVVTSDYLYLLYRDLRALGSLVPEDRHPLPLEEQQAQFRALMEEYLKEERNHNFTDEDVEYAIHLELRPFADLGLSVRTRKCCVRLGISTVGDLLQRTGDELLECPRFGVTSLNELREALASWKIHLRGESLLDPDLS